MKLAALGNGPQGLAWVAAAALATLLAFPIVAPIERRAFDARLSVRRDAGWPADVVLVPVNDVSIQRLGRWPWDRARVAALLQLLRDAGVKTVLCDVVFSGVQTPESDAVLEAALGDAVLPVSFVRTGGMSPDEAILRLAAIGPAPLPETTAKRDRLLTALPRFHAAARGAGHSTGFANADGLIRGHVPVLGVEGLPGGLPSLSLAAWLAHRGHSPSDVHLTEAALELPGGARFPLTRGEMFLDFVRGGRPPAIVPAHEILEGTSPPPASLKGALAVFYVDSVFTTDEHPTPLGSRTAGGLIHAYAVRTFDAGRAPRPLAPWIPLLASFAAVLAALRFVERQPPTRVAAGGAIGAAIYVVLAIALVPIADLFAPVAWPALFFVLSGTLLALRNGRVAESERARLRRLLDAALARSVPTEPQADTRAPTQLGPDEPKTLPGGPAVGRRYDDGRPSARGSVDSTPLLAEVDELDEPVEVGRYLVQRSLGKGGMGAIFLAIDQELARPVAIKVLRAAQDTAAFRRFRREALAVARLSHPNVVQIYEVGFDSAVPYLVMEYVAGGTASDLLRDPTVTLPLPWERATRIVEGVARGLGAAHATGIVHRDVKPANILLVSRTGDQAKVADFGIAKLGGGETLTREGSFVGTVGYLSPEQARGKEVDARSDVYSLGITWYKLLTGVSPYEGTTAEILGAQQHADLPDPRDLAPSIPLSAVEVLRRMTARDPVQRPKDGNVAAAALAAVLAPADAVAAGRG